ncbi:MAG: phosphoenolpyruvate--protein phosphotransferase [Ignavibacteria bacterium]|nr:phosphoenolpyruvate--protein phosphotransferase [Ignavibacteria bacterium]MBI3765506.1 phosphoenolpyruvate--protein phosphotransferase [Ignavibacteriales bacterium]
MKSDQPLRREKILKGVPASPGIAIGSAHLFSQDIPRVEERSLSDGEVALEFDRVIRALEKSSKELDKILVFAQQKVGDAKAKIFEAQIMVLHDDVLIDTIRKRIRQEKKNAEFIVSDEIGKYASLMLRAHDEYMHERAHDMEDLKNRIIRNLLQEKLISKLEGSVIIVAHTLTPADTMILSRNHVLGYATDMGGVTSHAALFSRSLKIPAVVGLGDVSREVETGDMLIIDGYSGTIVVHPTQERIEEFEQKHERLLTFEAQLALLKELPAETLDKHSVELSANIELPEELEYVVVQGSQGVGLYRTESLLIGRDDFPSEEEQYQEYKRVVDRIYPNRVIMRTFDIGGDKIAPGMAEEANPFLGWRGIRVCFDRPDLFMNQLRAMLRASTRKNLAIMFPMISTIGEVRKAKEYILKTKTDLRAKQVNFDDNIQVGVMIEVPAAALTASQIAAEVDFLSIGSNDLIQYLIAVDRGNSLVAGLYQEFEPSVLTTLKHVINAGHKEGIWVGICGEMAGNPLATALLIGLGMDELSVVPAVLPEIKKIIRSMNYSEMRRVATEALRLTTGEEIELYLRTVFRKAFPEIPLDNNNS